MFSVFFFPMVSFCQARKDLTNTILGASYFSGFSFTSASKNTICVSANLPSSVAATAAASSAPGSATTRTTAVTGLTSKTATTPSVLLESSPVKTSGKLDCINALLISLNCDETNPLFQGSISMQLEYAQLTGPRCLGVEFAKLEAEDWLACLTI